MNLSFLTMLMARKDLLKLLLAAVVLGWAATLVTGAFLYQRTQDLKNAHADRTLLQIQYEALSDTLKLVKETSKGHLYERQALPNRDSLRRAVRREVRRELEKGNRELIAALRFQYQADSARIAASVRADTAASRGDSLVFEIDEKVGAFHARVGLLVDIKQAKLDYDITITPDPEWFHVYATEDDYRVSVWLETDGKVQRLESFVKPPPIPKSKVDPFDWTSMAFGAAAPGVGLVGVGTGPHFRIFGGRFEVSLVAGRGFEINGKDAKSTWIVGGFIQGNFFK